MSLPLRRWLRGCGIAALALAAAWALLALWPYPELAAFQKAGYSTRFLDRNRELLHVLPRKDGMRREFTPLAEIPRGVTLAFVAAEDRRFWWHPGVDPAAVLRAAVQNRRGSRTVSGASTITMQLARMITRRGDGWQAKRAEAWDALRLEARLSKRQILELYLNHVPFGFQTEGVASGARLFFDRPLRELRAEEILLLTVVPRRPALYNPLSNRVQAADAAFALAHDRGFLRRWGLPGTRQGFDARLRIGGGAVARPRGDAVARPRGDAVARPSAATQSLAPHFILFLLREHPEYAGLPEVTTTLDLHLQKRVELAIRGQVWAYAAQRMTTGAGIVFDNRTGDILAYVGSADFNDEENGGQNDGVQATNQPGSCLKPFLYALAMEKGFLPTTILPDIPQDFGGAEVYVPANFNRRFNGPIRLRVALASSLNVPAVYTLQRLGVQSFADFLISLGFASLQSQRESLGVGLALGNAEVSLWELAKGFSVFPRGGRPLEPRMVVGTAGQRGARKGVGSAEALAPLSPYTAAEICRILSDQASRFLGFGSARVMNTPFAAMFKTGTANQFQHVWALGATPRYTMGIWMGNFTGETIIGRTGSGIPARVVAQSLDGIADPVDAFPDPPDSRKVRICALSGGEAQEDCPATVEDFVPRDAALSPCEWHRRTASGIETVYPPEYSQWLREGRKMGRAQALPDDGEGLEILQPADGAVYFLDPSVPASQQAVALETAGRTEGLLEVFVNGAPLGALPNDGSLLLPLSEGEFTVEIREGGEILGRTRYRVR